MPILIPVLLTASASPPAIMAVVPPRVIATSPKSGSVVDPGPLKVTVTFDQPMDSTGWSFVKTAEGVYPDCGKRPTLSPDKRSFTLTCDLAPGMKWGIGFNSQLYRNFRSARGKVPARPHTIWFATAPIHQH